MKFTQRERRKGKAPIIDPYAVGACKQIYGILYIYSVCILRVGLHGVTGIDHGMGPWFNGTQCGVFPRLRFNSM